MTDDERIAYAEGYAQASLAVALVEEMGRKGYTPEMLARETEEHIGAKFAPSYVEGVLEGEVTVTLRMAAMLADALDCDLQIGLVPRKDRP